MSFLRSNTATRVTVGPFLDKTDGITPEVALTVTSCKLTFVVDDGGVPTLVLDTAPTASGGANDMVHITGDDSGYYDLELAAANVNYVGRAKLSINDVAVHCPVFHEFTILPGDVYDSMFASTGKAVDKGIIDQGTAQAATASTLQLRAAAAFADDELIGAVVVITGGTGVGQTRVITDYVSATDTATVSPDWTTTPSGTIEYKVLASPPPPTSAAGIVPVNVTHWLGTAAATPSVAGVPEVDVTHFNGTAGTFAAGIPEVKVNNIAANAITASAIAADAITDAKVAADVTIASVTGAVGSVTGAVGSVTGNVGGNVVGSVASVTAGVTLANGAHGGAAAVITAKQIALTNADAGGIALDIQGTGTGNSHAVRLSSTNAKALAAASTNSDAISIDAPAGSAIVYDGTELIAAIEASTLGSKLDTIDNFLDTEIAELLASDVTYKRATAVTAFMFYMSLTDGTPGTGLTVTATISKDGGAFAGVAGAVTEVSAGWYKHNLTGTEMTADEVALKYTATGASQRNIKIRTQA